MANSEKGPKNDEDQDQVQKVKYLLAGRGNVDTRKRGWGEDRDWGPGHSEAGGEWGKSPGELRGWFLDRGGIQGIRQVVRGTWRTREVRLSSGRRSWVMGGTGKEGRDNNR